MTYKSMESSVDLSLPTEIFEFFISQTRYRYTNGDVAVTLNGVAVPFLNIKRNNLAVTQNVFKNNMTLEISIDSDLARMLIHRDSFESVAVNIRRTHVGADPRETDTIVFWSGKVTGITVSRSIMTISCENLFSSLGDTGLRSVYEKSCRHPFMGTMCGIKFEVIRQVFLTGLVFGQSVLKVSVATNPSLNFSGGFLYVESKTGRGTMHGVTRDIAYDNFQSTNRLITISHPFYTTQTDPINPNDYTVYIVPGCDHSVSKCNSIFGNLANFGGFPYIPEDNPYKNNFSR